jgi:DNA-binding beta-propeller fold protein YncE
VGFRVNFRPVLPNHKVRISSLSSRDAALLLALAIITALPTAQAATGWLLVANKGDRTLGIVDVDEGKQIATVPEDGITGHEVAASADGKLAFVPIYGDSGVGSPGTDGQLMRVIDIATRKVVSTVDFGKGVRPHEPLMEPSTGVLYVTTELTDCVTAVDPKTWKILGTIPTGQKESHMLAVTRDGRRGYTSNVGVGTVSVLDLEERKTLTIIPVCEVAQRIALSVDDHFVFTSDQKQPRLAVIDTGENKVKQWIPLPSPGYGTAPTPDGRSLIVCLPRIKKIGIVDLAKMELQQTIDVPKAPQEVLVRPDGLEAYVSCDASAQIAAIDTRQWKVAKLINAGAGADGLAWAKAQ